MANRRGDWLQRLHCALDRRRFDCEIPELVATGLPGNTRTWCDWDGRTFTHHCTVAVMVLDTPDPGFWQLKESAAATLTSDAGTATVTWLEST
jgi:hypothetical protein